MFLPMCLATCPSTSSFPWPNKIMVIIPCSSREVVPYLIPIDQASAKGRASLIVKHVARCHKRKFPIWFAFLILNASELRLKPQPPSWTPIASPALSLVDLDKQTFRGCP